MLAADVEPLEDADESSHMEHEGWSGKTADWERLSAEQFFPLEDGGFQDLTLDVPEPQKAQLTQVLLAYPNVIATTPGRTTLAQHYITVGDAVPAQQKPYRIPYSQREW